MNLAEIEKFVKENSDKQNKLSILNTIFKYAGSFSIIGILISLIASILYNFGYFFYFHTRMTSFPISSSEFIKDSIIIIPNLLFIMIPFIFEILILENIKDNHFLLSFYKKFRFVLSKKIKNEYYYIPLTIRILAIIFFASLFFLYIFCGLKFSLYIFLGGGIVLLFYSYINKNFISTTFMSFILISIFILLYISIGYSSAVYDDNIRVFKKSEYIKFKNGDIINTKIIKAYERGLLTLTNNSLVFFNFSEITQYSTGDDKIFSILLPKKIDKRFHPSITKQHCFDPDNKNLNS